MKNNIMLSVFYLFVAVLLVVGLLFKTTVTTEGGSIVEFASYYKSNSVERMVITTDEYVFLVDGTHSLSLFTNTKIVQKGITRCLLIEDQVIIRDNVECWNIHSYTKKD